MQISSSTEPEIAEPIGSQPWLLDFLAAKGFNRISLDTFSNGKATLKFEGNKFTAHPADAERAWTSDLEDADPATVKILIEQILKMRPFLSDTDLAKQRIQRQRLDDALAGIANTIRDGPDTHSGVQLRRFLWSLYNGHHVVNLWRMTCVLDSQRSDWISEIFAGAFSGPLQEDDIKHALYVAGEMERWEQVHPSADHLDTMREAERAIESVLRTLLPSRAHTELKHARDSLLEARSAIRRAKEWSPDSSNFSRRQARKHTTEKVRTLCASPKTALAWPTLVKPPTS